MSNIRPALPPLALTGSLLSAGGYLITSWMVIPALLNPSANHASPSYTSLSSSNLLGAWRCLFLRGAFTFVPLTLGSAAAAFGAAYCARAGSGLRRSWITVGGLMTGIILPWTVVLMKGTNDRLMALGDVSAESVSRDEVVGLLGKWNLFNYVRGGAALVAGVIALGLQGEAI